MENTTLSKKEERVLKWLVQYKKPYIKIYMWVIFSCTLFIWIRHWDKFTQSWAFWGYNAIIWLAFNLAVYSDIKYAPVLHDLIQRLSANKKILE